MANHLRDLVPDPNNARRHTPRNVGMIADALNEVGAARSIVIDEHNTVLAGNATVDAAAQAGIERVRIIDADGDELIAVRRSNLTEQQKTRLALFDNRAAELADWKPEVLAALTTDDAHGVFRDDELAAIIARLDGSLDAAAAVSAAAAAAAKAELLAAKGATPSPRLLPLDAIFTFSPIDPSVAVAWDAGFKVGCRSTSTYCSPALTHKWNWRFNLTFIDNDYTDYDHDKHLDAVRRLTPKYATVRDAMTPAQCAEAGIDHYPLEQIIAWADELAESAEHVIVIPKYDCIADIPDRFTLGYSVPTSYGGTNLPAELFKGRRVHLLGGSLRDQIAYLSILGDDVRSLDFNSVAIHSRFGGYVRADGTFGNCVTDLGLDVTNHRIVCMAISFGHIGRALLKFAPGVVREDAPDAAGEAELEPDTEGVRDAA